MNSLLEEQKELKKQLENLKKNQSMKTLYEGVYKPAEKPPSRLAQVPGKSCDWVE